MSSTYQLYIAKHPKTGLLLTCIQSFFYDSKNWIEAKKPTDEEIVAELHAMEKFRSMWTDDIHKADLWDDYKIEKYKKYLPEVDFVKVSIGMD